MKEATGEVSMTVIVIVAVAVIGAILAAMWPKLKGTIENSWSGTGKSACEASGGTWTCSTEGKECSCTNINRSEK